MRCPRGKTGLHEMKFERREVIGTLAFVVYKCKRCPEELSREVPPFGKDSKETPTKELEDQDGIL